MTDSSHPAPKVWPGILVISAGVLVTTAMVVTVGIVVSLPRDSGEWPTSQEAPEEVPVAEPSTAVDEPEPSAAPVLPPSRLPWGAPVNSAPFEITVMPDVRYEFRSPSGNLWCGIAEGSYWRAGCYVLEHRWDYPEYPQCYLEGCMPMVGIDGEGVAGVLGVRSGSAAPDLAQQWGESVLTLQYGESLTVGSVTCVSTSDGMFCEDATTRHGFAVSRSTYEEY